MSREFDGSAITAVRFSIFCRIQIFPCLVPPCPEYQPKLNTNGMHAQMKGFGILVMVSLLLMLAGPGFTKEKVPKAGLNEALFEAVGRNDAAMVRQLLKQGGSIHAQDGKGQTALLLAVDRNHLESAKLLIEAGSDVNAQDRQLDSPLLLAGARGYLEILKLTLEAKPDFLIYNRFGGTALIPACERGHVEVVKELLKTKVDINHVNRLGWTALLEAIILSDGGPSHQEIVRLLIKAGANINLPDGDGIRPLQHARNKGFTPIAKMLESAGA